MCHTEYGLFGSTFYSCYSEPVNNIIDPFAIGFRIVGLILIGYILWRQIKFIIYNKEKDVE